MTDPTQAEGETVPQNSGVLLQVKSLTVRTRAGTDILSDISFHIEPGELVGLTSLGHSGKSTLLQSLAGITKPASGEILIDGVSLYAHLKAFRPTIGFVSTEFALQQDLTVKEILQDASTLRLPRSTSSRDRKQRMQILLETTGLSQVIDQRVRSLGAADKRRLGIAVELMGFPKLLLVDDSAEPLTPFDEVQIAILLRELSRQGITIIHVNPRSRSAGISDKLIFLAPGGVLAWFGPPDEAFTYLKSFIARGVVKDLFGLQEALETLVNPHDRDGSNWTRRFKDDIAYGKYVDDPLHNRYPDLLLQTRPLLRIRLRNSSKEKLPPPITRRAGVLKKLMLLIRRNFRLLWRDKTAFLMLTIPPLVALIHFIFSSVAQAGSSGPPIVFNLLVFLVVLVAGLLAQNEIVKERAVYQREQRTTPLLIPYILSKLCTVTLLAIYQGVVWTVIHSFVDIANGLTGGLQALLPAGITFFLIALIGGIFGLIVSALSKPAMTSTGWVLLLTLPQLLFLMSPLSDWSKLAIMGLILIGILVGIQSGAGTVRT
ncbi:MAG TPA: ATP-binding cassette domain-containing protein [Anaerolineales bacterium]|nr:ATP-binding cassette domain-containing protein [Anaerolineales bacterium]